MHGEMTSGEDTARSANLFSEKRESGEGVNLEGVGTPAGNALERLDRTTRELSALVEPKAQETPATVIANLIAFCGHSCDAIGEFLSALFGSPEPRLEAHDAQAAAAMPGFGLRGEDLRELQDVRQGLADTRVRLQDLQTGPAFPEGRVVVTEVPAGTESLGPEIHQIREDLASVRQMLQQLVALAQGGTGSEASGRLGEVERYINTGVIPQEAPSADIPAGTGVETPVPFLQIPPSATGWEATDVVRVAGDAPESDRPFVVQQGNNDLNEQNTCAVAAQEMILNRLENNPQGHTESEILHEAVGHNWFNNGTTLENYGKVLEEHGCHVERKPSDWPELVSRLEHGEQAICSVNAGVLWNEPTAYGSLNNGMLSHNHAVWVSGVVYDERGGQREAVAVIVNDSGKGQQYEVPAAVFEQAWATSEHFAAYCSK